MNTIDKLTSVLCDPSGKCCIAGSDADRAIIDGALRELLAQQPDVPEVGFGNMPKKAAWVGLTDEEVEKIVDDNTQDDQGYYIWCSGKGVARSVEALLKERNT